MNLRISIEMNDGLAPHLLFPEDFTCAIIHPIFQKRNEEEGTETRIILVKLP